MTSMSGREGKKLGWAGVSGHRVLPLISAEVSQTAESRSVSPRSTSEQLSLPKRVSFYRSVILNLLGVLGS